MAEPHSYLSLLAGIQQSCLDVESKIRQFREYLLEVNSHINLVSRNNPEVVVNDLIFDSLAMIPLIEYSEGATLLDIGSGAGFPWIIHKIVHPDLGIVTVDSNRRKMEFQKSAARKLGFLDCRFVPDRVETLPPIGTDYAIAKAFGSFDLICKLAIPHLKIGGKLLLPRIGSELLGSEGQGFCVEAVDEYQSSPSGRVSNLLILKKI